MTEVNITKLSNTVVIDDESKIVTISAPGPQGADGATGASMTSLSDTVILNPANNHLLYYENGTGKWKNQLINSAFISDLGTSATKDTGTSQSSVIIGNDARLSDARTPTAHNQALSTITDAGGAAALDVGTTAGTVAAGDDARLSDARTPSSTLDHDASKITTGTLVVGRGGTGLTSISTLLNSNTTKSDVGLGNVTNIEAQPVNADLTAIAGLTSAADKGIQFTGSGTAGVYDLTAAGKALLDDADAAAQRTTLGLGTAATSATGDFVASSAVSTFGATLVDDADAATARTTLGAAATNHTHTASQLTGDMPDARIVASNVTQHAAQIDIGDLGNVTQAVGLLGAGSGIYWNGSAWVAGSLQATSVPSLSAYATAAHTHTDSYAMFIVTGVDKAAPGFVLDGKVATARTITEFYTKTSGGSCTATLKNGSNEIGQIATDSTGKVDSSLTNTSVSAGDRLGVVITSNLNALDLEIVVRYTA